MGAALSFERTCSFEDGVLIMRLPSKRPFDCCAVQFLHEGNRGVVLPSHLIAIISVTPPNVPEAASVN